ncbi:MAG: radical SAM protein [Acidobacteria bacterium]|nr:radical SAM protein [Acidobacteriota bacterium]
MTEVLSQTESLCPHCLRRIPAERVAEGDAVYLRRRCPEHGEVEPVLIWRNRPVPYSLWERPRAAPDPSPPDPPDDCPRLCGICPGHRQATCSAIVEVTSRCDLRCPVCFAASGPAAGPDPELAGLERLLRQTLALAGNCPLQLSGGEPTLRDDLPLIVRRAHDIGFDHVQVNTNGLRLGSDAGFARALADAGVADFFLQFDGVSDDVFRRLRGAPLLDLKLKALERSRELEIGVILVPTLVRGVNDSRIGDLIQFAKSWIPVVKGIHFQPQAWLGRYPQSPRNEDRVLIPDILEAIERQTGGELEAADFIPPG